jgi:putative transposase
VDETTFSLDFVLRRCWMKRGEQKTCPAHTGYREQTHLIGGLDWASDSVHVLPVDRKNSTTFSAFLEWLCLHVYPDQPLILVLDNVSYHHSATVMALLSLLQPRVQVLWLPKYSPDMNPIERFWLHLKNAVYANRLFASLAHLLEHIQLWLGFQNSLSHPNRFSFSKSFR